MAGLVVLVEITPALASVACHPQASQYRLIKGVDAASSAALIASGGTVSFNGARYAIADGKRFGFQAKLVRVADGIASPVICRDAIRQIL